MKVRVEEFHIKTGERRSLGNCPIANAITPCLPAFMYAIVSANSVSLKKYDEVNEPERIGELPEEAKAFIVAFDRGEPVKPFEFEIEYEPGN